MTFKSIVKAGEEIPRYHGIAYRNFLENSAVCYLIPFNWVVKWFRAFMAFLKVPAYSMTEQAEIRVIAYYENKYHEKVRGLQKEIDRRVEKAIDVALNALDRMDDKDERV